MPTLADMSTFYDSRPTQHDWMTPVITFTLIPASVHFGLLMMLLPEGGETSLAGDAIVRLLLIGTVFPTGTAVLILMNVIYWAALIRLCRLDRRPAPLAQLLLGLIYPAPMMAAATILGLIGRI